MRVLTSRDNSYEPPPGETTSQMVEISAESRSTGTPEPLSQESLDGELYACIPEPFPLPSTIAVMTATDMLPNGNSYQAIPGPPVISVLTGCTPKVKNESKPTKRTVAQALGPIDGDSYSSVSGRVTSPNFVSVLDNFDNLCKDEAYESLPDNCVLSLTGDSSYFLKDGKEEMVKRVEAEDLGSSIGESYASVQSRSTVPNIISDYDDADILSDNSLSPHQGNLSELQDDSVTTASWSASRDKGVSGGRQENKANDCYACIPTVNNDADAAAAEKLCQGDTDAEVHVLGSLGGETYSSISTPIIVPTVHFMDDAELLTSGNSNSNGLDVYSSSARYNACTMNMAVQGFLDVDPYASISGQAGISNGIHHADGTQVALLSSDFESPLDHNSSNEIAVGTPSLGMKLRDQNMTSLKDLYAEIHDDEIIADRQAVGNHDSKSKEMNTDQAIESSFISTPVKSMYASIPEN